MAEPLLVFVSGGGPVIDPPPPILEFQIAVADAVAVAESQPVTAILNVSSQSDMNAAVSAARPGNVILVADSIYNNLVIDTTGATSGNANAKIRVKSATRLGTTLQGSGTRVKLKGINHWTIDGFKLLNIESSARIQLFEFDNANDCIVQFCDVDNCGTIPVDQSAHIFLMRNLAQRHIVQFSTFKNINSKLWLASNLTADGELNIDNALRWCHLKGPWDASAREAIGMGVTQFKFTQAGLIWENSLADNLGALRELASIKSEGCFIRRITQVDVGDRIQGRSTRNTEITQNWMFRTKGLNLHGPNNLMSNNYLDDGDTAARDGPELVAGAQNYPDDGPDETWPVTDSDILNNTSVNFRDKGFNIGACYSAGPSTPCGTIPWDKKITGTRLRNNLTQVNDSPAKALEIKPGSESGNTVTTNVKHATGSGNPGDTIGGWPTADPKLTPVAINGYTVQMPQAISTALIGQGTPDPLVPDDIQGKPRDPVAPDIGCFEFEPGILARYGPLQPADVGHGVDTLPAITSLSTAALTDGQTGVEVDGGNFGFYYWDGGIELNTMADGSGTKVEQTKTAWTPTKATFTVVAGVLSGKVFLILTNMWGFKAPAFPVTLP